MRRRLIISGGLVALSLCAAAALRFVTPSEAASDAVETVMPELVEPPPGPRAPRSDGFGLVIGRATLAEVQALIAARNLACKDTSVRALMKAARDRAAVDATTGASAKKRSAREQNPWVRLSCEGTHAATIGDRVRLPGTGRLLFTFDSPEHPLRHVSFRRSHTAHEAALADVRDALDAMTAVYGPPRELSGTLPEPGARFEKLVPFRATWAWSDLKVTVGALSFGDRGVDVDEAVEVPWPIRAAR